MKTYAAKPDEEIKMKLLSRRTDDPRQNWTDVTPALNDDELVIPPCELWHPKSTKASAPVNDLSADVPMDLGRKNVPKEKPPTTSQCWAFMGALGGAGTTTLAVQMAHELAKQHSDSNRKSHRITNPQVCLVDLDFEAGSCSHHLDVEPGLDMKDLTGDASRVDTTLAQALMSVHHSGINVLAAPNILGANTLVNSMVVLALLDADCEMFPYVILDIPQYWQGWSQAAVGGSDFVGLVSDLTIPSLHMAHTKRDQLVKMFDDESICEIILTKYERRSLSNTLRLSDAQAALQCDIFGTICADQNTTRQALNCGEPVGVIRNDSRYAKDSRKLLKQIAESMRQNNQNASEKTHIAV